MPASRTSSWMVCFCMAIGPWEENVDNFKRQRTMSDLFEATVRVAGIEGANPLLVYALVVAAQRLLVTYGGSAHFGNSAYLVQLMRDLEGNPDYQADVRQLALLQGGKAVAP